MNAISGTRRAIKELADGTVRVQIDVDPQHRRAFFELFPDIDAPVALAPLVSDFEQPAPSTDAIVTQAAHEAVKGGELAKLAGRLCADPAFQDWLVRREWAGPVPDAEGRGEERAAMIVRDACGITSRAELDHNPKAAEIFHARIRRPWSEARR